jgi:hypothetical protein
MAISAVGNARFFMAKNIGGDIFRDVGDVP